MLQNLSDLRSAPRAKLIRTFLTLFVCLFIILLTIFFSSARIFSARRSELSAFPTPQRLLVVFAHADDEVTNSGLIRHWANLGSEITILTLTDGSANPSSDLSVCQPSENITQCRSRELSDSARILGIKRVKTPQLPDSKLIDFLPQATAIVSQEIEALQPDSILTMEPSGLNGLTDHRAAFLSVAHATQNSKIRSKAFLSTLPPPFAWILRSRLPSEYVDRLKVFPLTQALIRVKGADAQAHASQASTINGLSLGMGAENFFSWINFETYSIHDSDTLHEFITNAR